MYISAKLSNDKTRLILLSSSHPRVKSNSEPISDEIRTESIIGTKNYSDALKRAFTLATERIYFNPDMTYFLTFTYKGKNHTPEQVLHDVKQFIKNQSRKNATVVPAEPTFREKETPTLNENLLKQANELTPIETTKTKQQIEELKQVNELTLKNGYPPHPLLDNHSNIKTKKKRLADDTNIKNHTNLNQEKRTPPKPKYIYVLEYQRRGSIHVHMIANGFFWVRKNRNGYLELPDWRHGYTSVLEITDFDENFKPYLYLFKYMKKSQRIGKSFVHSSRNLDNYTEVEYYDVNINDWRIKFNQNSIVTIPTTGRTLNYNKEYYER